jgi:hypothetical protein
MSNPVIARKQQGAAMSQILPDALPWKPGSLISSRVGDRRSEPWHNSQKDLEKKMGSSAAGIASGSSLQPLLCVFAA